MRWNRIRACLSCRLPGWCRNVKWSYRIAKIAGIEVRVHVTFFLLVAFYAWMFYQQGGTTAAVQGVVFVLLIYKYLTCGSMTIIEKCVRNDKTRQLCASTSQEPCFHGC